MYGFWLVFLVSSDCEGQEGTVCCDYKRTGGFVRCDCRGRVLLLFCDLYTVIVKAKCSYFCCDREGWVFMFYCGFMEDRVLMFGVDVLARCVLWY